MVSWRKALNTLIQGEVSADRLALVPIRLISIDGTYFDEFAVIDTFFPVYLSLPLECIRSLNLPFAEQCSH